MIAQVSSHRFFEEILIVRADDVCLADYRGLDNDYVVYVANGRCPQGVKGYDFRRSAKEGDIVVNKIFGEAKEFLQTGVTKHRRKLVKHLVRKQQHMFALDNAGQQLAAKTVRVFMGPNENGGVENDLH